MASRKDLKQKTDALMQRAFNAGMATLIELLQDPANNYPAGLKAIIKGAQIDLDSTAESGLDTFRHERKKQVLEDFQNKTGPFAPAGEEENFFHAEPVAPKKHRGLLRKPKPKRLEDAFSKVNDPDVEDWQTPTPRQMELMQQAHISHQQDAERAELVQQGVIQPATTKEYVDWLEKYFKKGGMFTMTLSGDMADQTSGSQVYTAKRSMNLPALYGTSKLILIVPARVSVNPIGGDLGHSDLLLAGGGGNPNSLALYKDTVAELKRRGYTLQKLMGLYDGPEWNRQSDLDLLKKHFAAADAPAKAAGQKPPSGPRF